MYQCKECHELFDQPGESHEDVTGEESAYWPVPCCPYCGSLKFNSLSEDDPREER
jgi:hypothetical protein